MNILVTGGAGYIGSILVEGLIDEGHQVFVFDNLQRGHRVAVDPGANFVNADLGNRTDLYYMFNRYPIDVVMHLAAETSAAYSMTEPGRFFWNNVACGINLLDCMVIHGVRRMVISSSAAVYGQPKELPVTESTLVSPINAYGESKLIFERILHWYCQAYG